jgi:hypothetical protein
MCSDSILCIRSSYFHSNYSPISPASLPFPFLFYLVVIIIIIVSVFYSSSLLSLFSNSTFFLISSSRPFRSRINRFLQHPLASVRAIVPPQKTQPPPPPVFNQPPRTPSAQRNSKKYTQSRSTGQTTPNQQTGQHRTQFSTSSKFALTGIHSIPSVAGPGVDRLFLHSTRSNSQLSRPNQRYLFILLH